MASTSYRKFSRLGQCLPNAGFNWAAKNRSHQAAGGAGRLRTSRFFGKPQTAKPPAKGLLRPTALPCRPTGLCGVAEPAVLGTNLALAPGTVRLGKFSAGAVRANAAFWQEVQMKKPQLPGKALGPSRGGKCHSYVAIETMAGLCEGCATASQSVSRRRGQLRILVLPLW